MLCCTVWEQINDDDDDDADDDNDDAADDGVALVRIYDAGLKRAARGSLKIQDAKIAKIRHLGTIAQLWRLDVYHLRN